jgi:transposase
MSERDGRHLTRIIKKDRKVNLQELQEDFVNSTSTKVCKRTLTNFLHEHGFYGRVGARKPFVSETNRKKRLNWAKERKGWTNEWDNIIWSDESKFELFGGNGKRRVWRQPHERYDVDCLIPTVKSGQQGVMVWGCFTKYGLGPLVKLEGRVTALVYIDVLENYLLPFIDSLDEQENFIFQEDNAPIHTARVVKNWKQENGINSLPWPAQSPDLNPIENLWDELERQVRAYQPLPKNRENLWQILQETWSNIEINKYQNLIDSMPRRVASVINSKGHPTRY